MPHETLPDPIVSDRYEIREQLGRGAMGVVYRAFDHEFRQEVALKALIATDPEGLFRLKQEFRLLASIGHRNLVSLYDLEVRDRPFFTMELIVGEQLQEHLGSNQELGGEPFGLRSALAQVVEGLDELHANDKYHRDIKPSNVLVEQGGRVVLVDFGLATDRGSHLSQMSQRSGPAGTLSYMSPEQMRGEIITPAAEFYSLGVLLYEGLTGRLPRSSIAGVLNPDADPPPRPRSLRPWVPTDLDELSMRLLRLDPAERPEAREVLEVLRVDRAIHSARPTQTPFVGRGPELARLQAGLEKMQSGESAAVSVLGSSGVGKTALVRHFLAGVESRREALVLRSRCHPSESVRYEAVDGLVDELSRFLSHEANARVDAFMPRDLAALTRMFPVLHRVVPQGLRHRTREKSDEPRTERLRAFAALRQLIARIGDREPLVLWIDDLQWGDTDSAPLVRELLSGPDAPAALVILSYRDESGDSPLLRQLVEGENDVWSRIEQVHLEPLSSSDARVLFEELLGDQRHQLLSDSSRLLGEAGGSPFLLSQLARNLLAFFEQGRVPLPAEFRLGDLVARRIRALPESSRRLLTCVAVANAPVPRKVALSASGLDGAGRAVAGQLERASLLRSTRAQSSVAFEVCHDQIRQAVSGRLTSTERADMHAAILQALESSEGASAEAMAFHAEGCGEAELSVGYALVAARRAEDGLAFSHAADLYAHALHWEHLASSERADILRHRGLALSDAGRGREAADDLCAAASLLRDTGATSGEVARLQAEAAEQYMASGHLEEGEQLLEPLCKARGLSYPRSLGATLLRTLPRTVRLRILGPDLGVSGPVRDEDGPRAADLCWSAAKGLAAVDTLRAYYFLSTGFERSVSDGDRSLAIRFLALMAATILVPTGGSVGRWGRRLAVEAAFAAEETGEAHLLGLTAILSGQVSLQSARWRDALDRCDAVEKLLRHRTRGMAWECQIARMGAIRALEELGDFSEMHRRAELALGEAEDLGDRYGVAIARNYREIARIAADDLDGAESDARTVLEIWPEAATVHILHLYAVRSLAMIELARGRPTRAWAHLQGVWQRLRRSGLLFAQMVRIDLRSLRARVALACPGEDRRLLDIAREDQRVLAREERLDGQAWAALLESEIERRSGSTAVAEAALERALALFHRGAQSALADVCRLRLATPTSDEADAALAALRARGIVRPERWADAMAPRRSDE